MKNSLYYILIVLSLNAILGCKQRGVPNDDFTLKVPPSFDSLPIIPEFNQLSEARIELGRLLFHDVRLSGDGGISCASCHVKELAYADNRALSAGVHGRLDRRNSPSLMNVGYQKELFHDGGLRSLERQAVSPFSNENEMNFSMDDAAKRLASIEPYQSLSRSAYGRDLDPQAIAYALACFQRSLLSTGGKYDAFVSGDSSMLTTRERRGMELFFDEKNACSTCHSGFLFTDMQYHNIGLYPEYQDEGRARITLDSADLGKIKTPSLRNVAVTAPYMHDGSFNNLEAVVAHYNSGGKAHPNKSKFIKPLGLSQKDQEDLIAFLKALSDNRFPPQK